MNGKDRAKKLMTALHDEKGGIIISPAKQMRVDTDSFAYSTLPVFTEKTGILTGWIRSLSYEEQKSSGHIWRSSNIVQIHCF